MRKFHLKRKKQRLLNQALISSRTTRNVVGHEVTGRRARAVVSFIVETGVLSKRGKGTDKKGMRCAVTGRDTAPIQIRAAARTN